MSAVDCRECHGDVDCAFCEDGAAYCESCRRRGHTREPASVTLDFSESGGPRQYDVCSMCAREIQAAHNRRAAREEI